MLKSYSVQRLNRISKNREIWCFGCGKRLHEMLSLYSEEAFISRISSLLDNNSMLWGTEKKVGERRVSVSSSDIIRSQGNKNIIILITSDRYKEIYDLIFETVVEIGIKCSRYPVCYYDYTAVLLTLCSLLPMRRQILFNAGEEPHENAKAIVEYLTKQYQGKAYKLIFMCDGEESDGQDASDIVFVERNILRCRNSFGQNLRYCFCVATSKYLLYENEPLKKIRKRQKLIFLNHGTIPFKDVRDVLKQPVEVDHALCPSEECAEIYVQQYGIPKEKQFYIMPPRDSFLTRNMHKLEKVIPCEGKQIIIWLPTFRTLKGTDRKDSSVDSALPLLTNDEEFARVNEKLGENGQLLLIKNHPREKESIHIPIASDSIRLLSDEELKKADAVLLEILGETAALLTDYSGISFEYLLVDKPIGYVISDIDCYTRGFAFDNPWDYMPGEKINTLGELMKFFDDVQADRDKFQKEREELREKLFRGNEMKNGAEELVEQLEKLD